jgi:hypothetical protein
MSSLKPAPSLEILRLRGHCCLKCAFLSSDDFDGCGFQEHMAFHMIGDGG